MSENEFAGQSVQESLPGVCTASARNTLSCAKTAPTVLSTNGAEVEDTRRSQRTHLHTSTHTYTIVSAPDLL
jgi:hypothetical protein